MIARNDFISILGLYQYDDTVFDEFQLPSGMDREDVIDNLVTECAEFEVLYPDAGFMRKAIGSWSRKQLPAWTKLFRTEHFNYNPIWNKDGEVIETFEETRTGTSQQKQTGTDTNQRNTEDHSEATRQVSAFNEAGFHNAERNEGDTVGSIIDAGTNSNDITGSTSDNVKHTNSRKETGNIGVTTTQQMIREEREIDTFLTMDAIIGDFKRRFCLLVY